MGAEEKRHELSKMRARDAKIKLLRIILNSYCKYI